jgi:translation initiation factor IF-3
MSELTLLLLTTKKRKRKPTVDEIKQVMQSVLDTIREAGGTQNVLEFNAI